MNVRPRCIFSLFGRVFGFGFEISPDGLWGFQAKDKHHYTYTDLFAFGMVKRKGDEDINILRFVFGPFLFAFVFSEPINAVRKNQKESQQETLRQPKEEGQEATQQVATQSSQSGD